MKTICISETPAKAPGCEGIHSLLKRIKSALDEQEVVHWLDGGTALKVARDGHLVSSDLDISTWQCERDKVLKACEDLRLEGFRVKTQAFMPFVEDHLMLYPPDKYVTPFRHIDLHMYCEMKDEAVSRNLYRPNGKMGRYLFELYRNLTFNNGEASSLKHRAFRQLPSLWQDRFASLVLEFYSCVCESVWFVVPKSHFKVLSQIQIEDLMFNIPSDVEAYLEHRYGSEWATPNKNWRLCDGGLIRFRPLRRMPSSRRAAGTYMSDEIPPVISMGKNLFEFTEHEIRKIRDLDN